MTSIANPAAQAQAALHRTELLLERCRNGQAPFSAQSLWHNSQQTLFLAWLDAGGFTQAEAEKENSGTEPLFSAPQRDSKEEFKFSLVRIDDAVE
ncbi:MULTISPECIES: hypothetical protein [unclassified Duganella]|jgi:hypothetical protein|uniref:hypothetical protein n=1 Tax=unclassified Duganella TaxID=2636909 RepID=UPI0008875CF9|nr:MULTISPECIES: hypothetical protein [unclassified Duganella]SDG01791.1 hypothetical protein SAMN05216320_102375 [Duganella sp. OV458]SDJ03422.1 hypothetical protein SAMN05428973_102176 [Duganella sp. OV510]